MQKAAGICVMDNVPPNTLEVEHVSSQLNPDRRRERPLGRWFDMTPQEAEAWARGDGRLCDLHEESIWQWIHTLVRWKLPLQRGWATRPSPHDADDITQCVRLKAYESYCKDSAPLKSWLALVAERESINHYRKRRTKQRGLAKLEANALSDTRLREAERDEHDCSQLAGRAELAAAIESAAGRLTPRLRETFDVLATGADYKAVAEQLGCSRGTAGALFSRTVRAVCATLTERGYVAVRVADRHRMTKPGRVVLLRDGMIIFHLPGGQA